MGDEEQTDSGKGKGGLSKFSAMQIVIIIGIIVVATIFIAKFGFGTDLINPSSGEMAILKKPVTPVQQVVQTPVIRPTITIRPPSCASNQAACGMICTDTTTDPENCGSCGAACPSYPNMTRRCYAGSCIPPYCKPYYADCNNNPADGCEINIGGDSNNCGRCGMSCGSNRCMLGQCDAGGPMETYAPGPMDGIR